MRTASNLDGVLAALGLIIGSLGSGTAQATETQTVIIDNFNFKPNVITVKPGTHIVFKNQDDLPHTVVIPGMEVKSAMMDTDGTFEADFEKPGDFKYFCGVHPMMTGEVIVAE